MRFRRPFRYGMNFGFFALRKMFENSVLRPRVCHAVRRGTRFVRVVFMPEMVFDIQRGDGKFVEAEKPQT